MAVQYLGFTDVTGCYDRNFYNGYGYFNENDIYACPGSGSMEIKEAAAYVRNAGASAIHFRIAVYDAAHTTRLWYSDEITLAGGASSYAWVGVSGLSGTNLTGGTNYTIFVFGDSDDLLCGGNDGASGDAGYSEDTYGVPPASVTLTDGGDYKFLVRIGVDTAGGGAVTVTADAASFAISGKPSDLLHGGHGWFKYRKP